jgi:hypothetical protein
MGGFVNRSQPQRGSLAGVQLVGHMGRGLWMTDSGGHYRGLEGGRQGETTMGDCVAQPSSPSSSPLPSTSLSFSVSGPIRYSCSPSG